MVCTANPTVAAIVLAGTAVIIISFAALYGIMAVHRHRAAAAQPLLDPITSPECVHTFDMAAFLTPLPPATLAADPMSPPASSRDIVHVVKCVDRCRHPAKLTHLAAACDAGLVVPFSTSAVLADHVPVNYHVVERTADDLDAALSRLLWLPFSTAHTRENVRELAGKAALAREYIAREQATEELTTAPLMIDGVAFVNTNAAAPLLRESCDLAAPPAGSPYVTIPIFDTIILSARLHRRLSAPPFTVNPRMSWPDAHIFGWYRLHRRVTRILFRR